MCGAGTRTRTECAVVERAPLREDMAATLRLRGLSIVDVQSLAGTVLDALTRAGFSIGWEAPPVTSA